MRRPRLGLLYYLLKGAFKVSSGTVEWYRSIYGTDVEKSEIASSEQSSMGC